MTSPASSSPSSSSFVSRGSWLAYRLSRLYAATDRLKNTQPPEPFRPGPATLKRLSAGKLIIETIVHVHTRPEESRADLIAEYRRRELHEVADMVDRNDYATSRSFSDPGLESACTIATTVATVSVLDTLGDVLDSTDEQAYEQVNPTMLSPLEQVSDLVAVGADSETIHAFLVAQGTSDVSPSMAIAASLDTAPQVSLANEASVDVTHTVDQDVTL